MGFYQWPHLCQDWNAFAGIAAVLYLLWNENSFELSNVLVKSTDSPSLLPDRSSFALLAQGHALVPVYRRIASDILTPVSAFHRLDSTVHAGFLPV